MSLLKKNKEKTDTGAKRVPFDVEATKKNRTHLTHYLQWEHIYRYARQITEDYTEELAIVIHKDGCLQQTFGFRGQDLDSCSAEYIAGVDTYFNECIKRLGGDGWMVSVEAQRFMTRDYPESEYDNLAAYLVEQERKESFEAFGEHFDSDYYVTFVYKPEIDLTKKAFGFFLTQETYEVPMEKEIRDFIKQTDRVTSVLAEKMLIRPLNVKETAQYLHSTVSLKRYNMIDPGDVLFVDSYVADEALEISQTCKLGEHYIPVMTINDFPSNSYPAILHELNKLQVEYRWVSRYFPMSKEEAKKELEKWQKKHYSNRKSGKQFLTELAFNVETGRQNQGAAAQQSDVEDAQSELETDIVGFGYYNSSIMVWARDLEQAMIKMKTVRSCIESMGFSATEETFGAFDAFLGMTAGDVHRNIRRPLVSTRNYTNALPLSAVWSGMIYNKHTFEICGVDKPLLTCSTNYGTPFFMSLNEGDVGHTAIFGPTGAGKSTFLNLLEVSFLKYANSQVFILDKGLSALTLTLAVGGEYVNPTRDTMTFQPLAELDTKQDRVWATEFIETLLVMQDVKVTASMSVAISATLDSMSEMAMERRTLTTFKQNCMFADEQGRNPIDAGITPYTLEGPHGNIFDGSETTIQSTRWLLLEMEGLMEMGEKVVAPAIMYIFRFLEKKFTGALTLLVLDEAWAFLSHPIFEAKLREWLKVLRKKNVFCVFATQEVADIAKSKICSTVIQNCPTKIFLADPKAHDLAQYYQSFGLTSDEISILAVSRKKRDYYYKSSYGTRLFQLSLGPLELALFKQQQSYVRDEENGIEYLWSQYCDFLLMKKSEKKYHGGYVKEILKMQKIEYEKYLEGIEYEEIE